MPASRLARALLLPALAVLLPFIFIVGLATRWLALERETSQLRGAEAAASVLSGLRTDLRSALAAEAGRVSSAGNRTARLAPAVQTSLASDWFLFDRQGRLVGPSGAMETPAASRHETDRAASLLSNGASALEAGNLNDATRDASALLACCAGSRDEFGVSYAVYASWQLSAIGRRRPGLTREAIVNRLQGIIDRGVLDRPGDVAGVRAFANSMQDVTGAAGLVAAVEVHVARAERRRQSAGQAKAWMTSIASDRGPLVVAPWRSTGPSVVAALFRSPGSSVVLLINQEAMAGWVAAWRDESAAFTFSLGPSDTAQPDSAGILRAPLFDDTPGVTVAAARQSEDPTLGRRARLFATAAVAVLVLTLVAAGFAVRDVIRERRLAALRATFLAGVTHEIKTPITSIRLMAETIQQRRATPEATTEWLGTIVNEAEHLSDLVDNLLSTSRIESGARTYRARDVSLVDTVSSACRRFEYTLTKEGFTLERSLPRRPIVVCADPEALQQAVLNLLGNAMKYSGDSRVIRLEVEAMGDRAVIRVIDQGIGVAAGEQSRIFKSFYRSSWAERTTTGTGLGLALVRHFAESHGGSVSVSSAPGAGSSFTIELPASCSGDTIGETIMAAGNSPTSING